MTEHKIYLRGKDADRFALVDEADFESVSGRNWYLNHGGYAVTNIYRPGRSPYMVGMHRVLMGLQRNDGLEVDHINRDRLDNRRANLRVVESRQNDQNRGSTHGHGTSTYRGVSRCDRTDGWRAAGTLDGQQVSIGRYDSEIAAAKAAEAWRRAHMPYFVPEPALNPVPSCECRQCEPLRGSLRGTGTSPLRGVTWYPQTASWRARVIVARKPVSLGLHATQEAAARACEAYRRTHLTTWAPQTALDPVGQCQCRSCRTSNVIAA